MPQKPIYWIVIAGLNLIFWGLAIAADASFELRHHCENLFWFSLAIAGLLVKLNQLAERIENAQRLQTTAFRTLRK